MVCFFGHRDASMKNQEKIFETIQYLVEQKGENIFYVGTHGSFDRMVYNALKKAKEKYAEKQGCEIINLGIEDENIT